MSAINGANAVRAARRTFLSFLGGAATLTLTPAAIATAKPVDDDAEFLRLYRAFEETTYSEDLSNYQEVVALREQAVHIMARMPVRTLAGLRCKIELMTRCITGWFPSGSDLAVWSEVALRDIREMAKK